MILTVAGGSHDGANIQVSERLGGNAQTFFNRFI